MLFISDLYLESKGKKGQKLNCPHYIPQSDSLVVSLAASVDVVVLLVIATWSNPLLPINFSTAAALNANPLRDWKSMRPNLGDAIGLHHRCLGQMQTNSTSYVMCKDKKGGNGGGGAQGNYNNQILTNIYKTKRKSFKKFLVEIYQTLSSIQVHDQLHQIFGPTDNAQRTKEKTTWYFQTIGQ